MTDTIIVTDTYVVDPSVKLKFSDQTGFLLQADAEVDLTVGGKVIVAAHADGGDIVGIDAAGPGLASIDILGHGSVKVSAAGTGASATGIALHSTPGHVVNARSLVVIADHATGIAADGLQLESSGSLEVSGALSAIGVAAGHDAILSNSGDMLVLSAEGAATGMAAGAAAQMENLGTITVTAHDDALGVSLDAGGTLDNQGLITVKGSEAIGVRLNGANLDNSGDILAATTISGNDSFAVYIGQDPDDPAAVVDIHNTGTISGPLAIYEDPKLKSGGIDNLTNDGEISGFVNLGRGADTVINNGSMAGHLELGGDNDVYHGEQGKIDFVIGGGGDDLIVGGDGRDIIFGDEPWGGDGDDTLVGGRGTDQLGGDGGADTFIFNAARDSKPGHGDRIIDLDGADHIDLSAIDADHIQSGEQAFHLVDAFSGNAGELCFSYDEHLERTTLSGDVDGDGQADMEILIDGNVAGFAQLIL